MRVLTEKMAASRQFHSIETNNATKVHSSLLEGLGASTGIHVQSIDALIPR